MKMMVSSPSYWPRHCVTQSQSEPQAPQCLGPCPLVHLHPSLQPEPPQPCLYWHGTVTTSVTFTVSISAITAMTAIDTVERELHLQRPCGCSHISHSHGLVYPPPPPPPLPKGNFNPLPKGNRKFQMMHSLSKPPQSHQPPATQPPQSRRPTQHHNAQNRKMCKSTRS